MDHFNLWARSNKICGQLVPTMLQVVPMSGKAKEKLEDYNEEGKPFIKRIHPPIDLIVSRTGHPKRDYKVWAYEITHPDDVNKVLSLN